MPRGWRLFVKDEGYAADVAGQLHPERQRRQPPVVLARYWHFMSCPGRVRVQYVPPKAVEGQTTNILWSCLRFEISAQIWRNDASLKVQSVVDACSVISVGPKG